MKKLTLILMVCLISKGVLGQIDSSYNWMHEITKTDADYFEIYNSATDYYNQNETAPGKKSFIRWSTFWERRVGDGQQNLGTFDPAYKALINVFNGNTGICDNSIEDSEWELLGPISLPTPLPATFPISGNPSTKTTLGMGIVTDVTIDESDPSLNTIYVGTNASGIWKTTNAESLLPNWENITQSTRLPVLGVEDLLLVEKNNNKIIYAATGVTTFVTTGYGIGVIKSTDDGVSWEETALTFTPLTDKTSCQKLVVHPDNPDLIYALCENRVYKTTDGFETVSWINEEFQSVGGCDFPLAICLANDGQYCGIPNEPKSAFIDLKFHPTNPNTIYLSKRTYDKDLVNSEIVISYNGGSRWCRKNYIDLGLPGNPDLIHIETVPLSSNPGDEDLLILGCVDPNPNLFDDWIVVSNDNGMNFDSPFSAGGLEDPTGSKSKFVVSPKNPNLIYWGAISFYRSDDGGASFDGKSNPFFDKLEFMHDDSRALEVFLDGNGNEVVYVGHDGGISKITDPGGINTATWDWEEKVGTGLSISQFYGIGLADDYSSLVGGCQDIGSMKYEFRTKEWVTLPEYGDGGECVIDPANPNRIIAQRFGDGTTTKSEESLDNGATFNFFISGSPNGPRPMEIDDNGTVYVGYNQIRKKVIGGSSTEEIGTMPTVTCPDGSIQAGEIKALAVAPSDNNIIYAARPHNQGGQNICGGWEGFDVPVENKFFVTYNAHDPIAQVEWVDIGKNMFNPNYDVSGSYTLHQTSITDIAVDPKNAKRVWVSLDRFDSDANGVHNVVAFSEIGGDPGNDNPNAWIDMTRNLPDFPANAIIYQAGTPDYVYIGTDVGVWVNKDASNPNSPWSCFNKNLPVTIITDLEINECAGKIVASTFGNGIWQADLLAPPAKKAKIVGNSATWNTDRDVFHDLIVESGKTLTIQAKVNMGAGRKIIVEPGAKLVLEGGAILTNDCNAMWGGIEVWGDPNTAFTQSTHGYLHIKQGSLIEHAVNAIELYDSGHLEGTDQISQQGGIVIATKSAFKNNQRTFDMVNYGFDTYSEFYQCNFNIDDEFRGEFYLDEDFDAHITMTEAKGLLVRESNFSNNKTNTSPCVNGNCKGEGIRTLDGGFEVKSSNFINFDKGIYAGNTLETNTFSVTEGCLFRGNFTGIQVEGVNNFKVTETTFDVGGYDIVSAPDIYPAHLGLVNIGGTGFIIEENDFIKDPIGINELYEITYGTWIHNSNLGNSYANDIYRNDFENLEVANLGSGKNKYSGHHGVGFGGLEYLCNGQDNMTNNLYDFVVGGEGIAPIQGSDNQGLTFSAGNVFTPNAPTNFWHFFNAGGHIDYRYQGFNPNSPDFHYTDNTMNFIIADEASSCESRFFGEPTEPDKIKGMLIFDEHESSFISGKSTLESSMDGGNTNNLLIEVTNVTGGNADNLKNNLLNISPFVSGEVLQAFANRTDIYTHNDIYNVLVANPEEANQADMLDFLASKPTPMPSDLITNLISNTQYQSEKGDLDHQLHYHYKMMNFGADLVLHDLKQDTLGTNFEDIKTWINNKSNELPNYDFVETHIASGDINTALQLLNSIPQTYNLTGSQLDQYNRYQTLKGLQANLKANNKTWLELEENDLDNLKMLAEGDDLASIQAKLILNHGYQANYRYIPELPNQVSESFMIAKPNQQFQSSIKNSNEVISAFPNPARGQVFFKYNLGQDNRKAILYIRDLDGKLLKEFQLTDSQGQVRWNTENINSGVYIYNISLNGKDLESQKIVIAK